MSISRSIVQPIFTGRRIWDHILKYDPVEIYNNNFDGGKDSWKDFNSGQGVVSAGAGGVFCVGPIHINDYSVS